jgi:hypothetical protein
VVTTADPHHDADELPATPLPVALPVTLDLRARTHDTVRRTVEGQLGWQPVDELTASLVPPAVRLVDVAASPSDATPAVLLVASDDDPLTAAQAVDRLRPAAIVAWPDADGRLPGAVARATVSLRSVRPVAATLRIGGAGGGVGTTTIAAAVAGASGWRGRRTLLVSGDRVLLPARTPTVAPSALAATDLWERAAPVAGVPGARAVRTTEPAFDGRVSAPSVEATVVDLGVADDVDVLVCRPDAAAVAVLERTSAAAVVVVGDGPVPARDLVTSGRRRIDVPWSARVARAAVVGRVPASLPGRFVRALLPLVPGGEPAD